MGVQVLGFYVLLMRTGEMSIGGEYLCKDKTYSIPRRQISGRCSRCMTSDL
jgi:hypothetical protein